MGLPLRALGDLGLPLRDLWDLALPLRDLIDALLGLRDFLLPLRERADARLPLRDLPDARLSLRDFTDARLPLRDRAECTDPLLPLLERREAALPLRDRTECRETSDARLPLLERLPDRTDSFSATSSRTTSWSSPAGLFGVAERLRERLSLTDVFSKFSLGTSWRSGDSDFDRWDCGEPSGDFGPPPSVASSCSASPSPVGDFGVSLSTPQSSSLSIATGFGVSSGFDGEAWGISREIAKENKSQQNVTKVSLPAFATFFPHLPANPGESIVADCSHESTALPHMHRMQTEGEMGRFSMKKNC